MAARLLHTPSALAEIGSDDARCIVSYMRLLNVAAGTTILREGDASNTAYLLLVLVGDVRVESGELAVGGSVDISVLGPGSVIGEMALLDGAPRSTTCTALTAVQAAALSRRALDVMVADHPHVAARLLIALAQRMADRLRALGQQLGTYARLAHETRAELDRLKGSARH